MGGFESGRLDPPYLAPTLVKQLGPAPTSTTAEAAGPTADFSGCGKGQILERGSKDVQPATTASKAGGYPPAAPKAVTSTSATASNPSASSVKDLLKQAANKESAGTTASSPDGGKGRPKEPTSPMMQDSEVKTGGGGFFGFCTPSWNKSKK